MDRSWQYGKSMVMNLLQAGFEVSVFNRTKEKEAPLLGGSKIKQFTRTNGNL
jgi:3-hydroxyisobutyrate dehydrogenase-like beta-hydroxyacid dehydrogenase